MAVQPVLCFSLLFGHSPRLSVLAVVSLSLFLLLLPLLSPHWLVSLSSLSPVALTQ